MAFLFTTVNKVWIFVDFKLNQDYIAQELCENKEKPELSCHGKCHLVKELKAEEEKENKDVPSRLKVKSELLFVYNSVVLSEEKEFLLEENVNSFFYKNLYQNSYVDVFFQPPKYA